MSMDADRTPTARSRALGGYFKFKGLTWAVVGATLLYAALSGGTLEDAGPLRLSAFFLLMFAVPSVLLWTLGTVVKIRHPAGWWIGLVYVSSIVAAKTILGTGELPGQSWYWLSHHLPPTHLLGMKILAIFSVLVYALDIVVLVALLSARGRDCFDVGTPNPSARA
jgi:hypothetical protein